MGKGGRCPETRAGRYARCETPKPCWGSSARGGTLESWVLRKAHARVGEGRMEKCSQSNSPAAYGGFKWSSQHGLCGFFGGTGPEPRPVFSSPGSFAAFF